MTVALFQDYATVMRVPLLDLQAQYQPLRDELLAAISRVCDSQHFILGPEVETLETELARELDVQHTIGVSSGTDALLVAMMALDIGPGDEVITSAYSFFATGGCVARLGATPVFVDIDSSTFALDPRAVAAAITPRTRAIIPVHLYGLCADMDPLLDVASRAGLPLIEDACQAIGATYRGRQAGGMGTLGCFSFFPSKNLGAFGDGGLVTTNDAALAAKVRLLRSHGAEPKYYHARIGGNFRLDAIQAAVLRVKLPHLRLWSEKRRANADRYDELFREHGLETCVRLPIRPNDRTHIFNQYVVRVADRDRVRTELKELGIGTEVYYPVPLHLQECFADLGGMSGSCPRAEAAARDSLALPIYGELSYDQQVAVVRALREVLVERPQRLAPVS
jgi:dTDP-4-amino-4,6-dideoxygalactose transaminase